MCTVTYLPLESGYLLTSNRDVPLSRARALPPKAYEHRGQTLWYPLDPPGQGTWMVTDLATRTLVLLNGAWEAHQRRSSYPVSRGVVLLNWMMASDADAYFEQTDLDLIEPFTVVDASIQTLVEYRWDGRFRHRRELDILQPQIWSSVTLYSEQQAAVRAGWFANWLQEQPRFEAEDILTFHQTAGAEDPEQALCMRRPDGYATVSMTQVRIQHPTSNMFYQDLHPTNAAILSPIYSNT